jgi:hypothetical protein
MSKKNYQSTRQDYFRDQVNKLKAAGVSDEDIYEFSVSCCYFYRTNTFSDAAKLIGFDYENYE